MSGFRNFNAPTSSSYYNTPTLNSATDDDDWRTQDEDNNDHDQHTNTAGGLVANLPSQSNNWREQREEDWLAQRKTSNPPAPTYSSNIAVKEAVKPSAFKQQQYQYQQQQHQPKPVASKYTPPVASRPPGPTATSRSTFIGDTANRPLARAAESFAPPPPKPVRQDFPSVPSRPLQHLPATIPAFPDRVAAQYSAPSSSSASTEPYSPRKTMGVNTQALSVKYPYFTASEISAYHQQYTAVDKEGRDSIHQSDLSNISTKAGASPADVVAKLQQLSLVDQEGLVSFEGFLKAVSKVREEKGAPKQSGDDKKKIVLHGHLENTTHTINEDEKESFTQHINWVLTGDKDESVCIILNAIRTSTDDMPITKDGLILAKLINDAVPNTIDERVLNISKKINTFQMTENNNVVVNSAKAIGCSVVNIGAQDLIEAREHLILGLIWQIIKIGLQAKIDIKVHPELFRLLEQGESLEDFLKLPPEQILLRWFNYHLKKAGWDRKVTNFSGDVKDAANYTVLLNQLAPSTCSRAPLQTADLTQRAEQVLENADKLGCRKYLTAKTIVNGNPKLNFAFVANLFNTHPGLEKLSEAEMAQLDEWLFSSEGDREARAFALWLNSLGLEPFVNNLFDDLQDGLILLQAMDKVRPGLVDWKKVNKAPVSSKFKKVENTNYVVVLGKSLKFSLVGIQGSDLTDGNKTLTLGLVWQLMREHVITTLKSLTSGGVEITDADMVKWANETVARGGKSSKMSSFKDSDLRNGLFFLDLLSGIKKGIVNYDLVTPGVTDEDAKMNAKYAISIARKLGATIFVLPEDIVEVKPKMILTFVGTLMAVDKHLTGQT
ncbi:hypothetical protein HK104_000099 [Borealophlyctis nickersoniae]|nr:hypothetical protein HK104_000099 [Borealophlyctis nickersoniae]